MKREEAGAEMKRWSITEKDIALFIAARVKFVEKVVKYL